MKRDRGREGEGGGCWEVVKKAGDGGKGRGLSEERMGGSEVYIPTGCMYIIPNNHKRYWRELSTGVGGAGVSEGMKSE